MIEKYQTKIDVENGPLKAAFKAKEEGLINHLSFSFHDDPENLFKIIDTGYFESMLVQYNLLDRSNEAGIEYAKKQGLGVIIMGPVGGGRLASPSTKLKQMMPQANSTVETALRFVMSNSNVDVTLSGMENIKMVKENIKVATNTEPLSESELESVQQMLDENEKLADLYCTGCEYCLPCAKEINIPKVFELMNYHRVYELTDYASKEFKKLLADDDKVGPQNCIECGVCEEKCPQNIEIITQLKETIKVLS